MFKLKGVEVGTRDAHNIFGRQRKNEIRAYHERKGSAYHENEKVVLTGDQE